MQRSSKESSFVAADILEQITSHLSTASLSSQQAAGTQGGPKDNGSLRLENTSGITKSNLWLIPTLTHQPEHQVPHPGVHTRHDRDWADPLQRNQCCDISISSEVPNWPVLSTNPTQHKVFQAELWDVTLCAPSTPPHFAASLWTKHHCVLKHVLTSNTPRKTQEFYSVTRRQHRRVTTLIFTDRKWKMAQTQLSASLKEHPKLSETREFKIAIGLEDKYSN